MSVDPDSKTKVLTILMLGAYAVIVLTVLGVRPLWADELLQLSGARTGTWRGLLHWAQVLPGGAPLPLLAQKLAISALGWSNWAVRLPAALFGIGSAALFWRIARGNAAALAMFLAMPILFRYATEGRMYSQALFFVLLAWWVERRWIRTIAAIAALYSSPFAIFPLVAIDPLAAGAAMVSFLPWWMLQRGVQAAQGSMADYQLAWGQLAPLSLLREFTGGGYWCGVSLLALVCASRWGVPPGGRKMVAASLIGPPLADALAGYFFAVRQWLFALPVLILAAADGMRFRFSACVLTAFLIAASVKDTRMTFHARENWGLAAHALRAETERGACPMIAPAAQLAYYSFYEPKLENRVCGPGPVVVAVSPYTTAAEERRALGGAVVKRQISIGTIRLLSFEKVQ